jgi:hypothetical protein
MAIKVLDAVSNMINGVIRFVNQFGFSFREIDLASEFSAALDRIEDFREARRENAAELAAEAAETTRQARLLYNTYEQLAESIAEVRKQKEAENFELRRESRNLSELVDEYEELQRLKREGVFGEEQQERERDLEREFENLDASLRGSTMEQTFENITSKIQANSEQVIRNLRTIADEALILFDSDPQKFLEGRGGGLLDLTTLLIENAESDSQSGLNSRQKNLLGEFYKNFISNIAPGNNIDIDEMLTIPTEAFTSAIVEFDKQVDRLNRGLDRAEGDEEPTLLKVARLFNETLEDIGDSDAQDAFRAVNQDLVSLLDSMET